MLTMMAMVVSIWFSCGGDHVWRHDPLLPPWPEGYDPGPDNPRDWYCMRGDHRGFWYMNHQPPWESNYGSSGN